MVTILWQQQANSDGANSHNLLPPLVKAHVCSSLLPSQPLDYDPDPMSAVLAIENPDNSWPSRKGFHPEAKLSSWCRQRRPLEVTLKKSGIGEVLLVDAGQDDGDVEILEGLISNVFFVYPGGYLRTAHRGVLNGFARHLVLQLAEKCGLTPDLSQTVSPQDCNQWQEVFVTSSTRLVAPVEQVFVPSHEQGPSGVSFQQIWSKRLSSKADCGIPFWRQLYIQMLSNQYIQRCGDRGTGFIMNMISNIWKSA
jgi:hypothetical protein